MTTARRDRDRAVMAELAGRLARLERDLECMYLPALRRLVRSGEPGARHALAELVDGDCADADLVATLDWSRRAVEGIVFAAGDPALYEFWRLGLDGGGGRRPTDGEVLCEIVKEVGPAAPELYELYLAGKRKSADGEGRPGQSEPSGRGQAL